MCSAFMFDPVEYERVKREWEDLRARVAEVRDRFGDLEAITARPPANDPATNEFLARARLAVDAARVSNTALHDYAAAFLKSLDQTAAAYTKQDDDNAQTISGSPTAGT